MSNLPVIDWMALTLVPGLGSKTIWQLVNRFGGVQSVFSACAGGQKKAVNIRESVFASLANPGPLRENAAFYLQNLHAHGGRAVCPDDSSYPELLQETVNPPPVLYVQGRIELLNSECVAMVGSRAATGYGRRSAFALARDLAASGVTVVSGLALGVDSEAHSGALAANGATIGVLGCGLDVVYPRQNHDLYTQIRKHGLLVSEYLPGTRPEGFRFPARNRIIAGLSRGVVVVEAARKSGSLITAELALEEGREIFAVPGQIDSFKSCGTHWLLQQGAKLVQSADDILVELNNGWKGRENSEEGQPHLSSVNIDPEALAFLQVIDVYPCPRNELIASSGLGPAKVTELLLLLEMEGTVEILPGDQVRRIL
ncbi:MAG: DNA-processing protein DprA [Proteobacteria bacterium]|nr:DNA-processing protein DprA [Pseudomonadota bacterium]MBU1232678.1 DNA-processing protein DprA [Pseudomonadota bacterium]MBU1418867.1 DNA-processing protein DprA [Pseudomonadota bacterium]MBU1455709.1 DNA-processing protein DprA [Pseudomonadota bacterium]